MALAAGRTIATCNNFAPVDVVVIILASSVPVTIAIITSHGVGAVIIARVSPIGADFSSFISIVVIITLALPSRKLAFTFVLTTLGGAGENKWCRWWRLLNDDLLRLSSLTNDDGRPSGLLGSIVFGFLANTLYLMAMRVIEAFFCALFDSDLFIAATAIPITAPFPILIAAATISTDARPVLAIIIAIAVVGRRFKR
jgi:hypothetical protein